MSFLIAVLKVIILPSFLRPIVKFVCRFMDLSQTEVSRHFNPEPGSNDALYKVQRGCSKIWNLCPIPIVVMHNKYMSNVKFKLSLVEIGSLVLKHLA